MFRSSFTLVIKAKAAIHLKISTKIAVEREEKTKLKILELYIKTTNCLGKIVHTRILFINLIIKFNFNIKEKKTKNKILLSLGEK